VWTQKKSVHPSSLDAELEEFGLLTKCETKSEKTYYWCPMRKRFGCGMVVRTVREVMEAILPLKRVVPVIHTARPMNSLIADWPML
jgi:hypothetical protein